MREWRSVEDEHDACWNEIADRIYAGESPYPGLCPSCGQAEIRYFYWRFDEDASPPRGGLWVWCPACLRYSHYSAYVPEWWRNLPGVPYGELAHDPEWLEDHWDQLLAAGHPMGARSKPIE